MAAQTDPLEPPIDATYEVETICFDYGMVLAPGETILSVAQMLCNLVSGLDSTPSSRLVGGAQIVNSPTTGAARAAVLQRFGNVNPGCDYALQCVATTSDQQSLSLKANIASMPSLA